MVMAGFWHATLLAWAGRRAGSPGGMAPPHLAVVLLPMRAKTDARCYLSTHLSESLLTVPFLCQLADLPAQGP